MRLLRLRLAIALLSLAVIGLEMSFMRVLALRFWHHFAYMVISVSLMGFGASGAALTLARRRATATPRRWFRRLTLAFAVSAPLAYWACRLVPLEVQFLAWEPLKQSPWIALIELLMFVPFFFAGAAVGTVLLDKPDRIGGHYAANLMGSGAGALAAVGLMHVFEAYGIILVLSAAAFAGGLLMVGHPEPGPEGETGDASPTPSVGKPLAALVAGGALFYGVLWLVPHRPLVSDYKMLSEARRIPGTEFIHHATSPLGRIDVAAGPALHFAPGLSLHYVDPVPPHALLMVDGEQAGGIYDVDALEGWRFMDFALHAAAHRIRPDASTMIVGAGGGADIGLALYHGAPRVKAIEMNGQLIEAMKGPLAERGGRIYEAPGVEVVHAEARGYAMHSREQFDVIQVPATDAFGAAGGGLYAAQENYLYTVEGFAQLLQRLNPGGALCATRWVKTPPRDGIRLFDMVARALERMGLDPAPRMAMLRSWVTVSVIASPKPLTAQDLAALRRFSEERGFDLCYLPDISAGEANRYHALDRPYYYEAAQALLGEERGRFLAEYLFDVEAVTDDRPYFHHFLKPGTMGELRERLKGQSPAFIEVGRLLIVAAFVQTVALAAILIFTPLAPGVRAVRAAPRKAATLAYFLALGGGFMLVEMGFLQRFILYLASPVYSAAAVVCGFLVFGGLGSALSRRWKASPRTVILVAGSSVALLGLVYLAALGLVLERATGLSMPVRFGAAVLAIAPLALAMGHMFPTGLRIVSESSPELVPWAWAVNGCASVAATVGAPLLAMQVGFARAILLALALYVLAALSGLALGRGGKRAASATE